MHAAKTQAGLARHHPPHLAGRLWCGREGWLTVGELSEKTKKDIEAYSRKEPLKFRQAMIMR